MPYANKEEMRKRNREWNLVHSERKRVMQRARYLASGGVQADIRRQKYNADDEYRERILASNRASYHRRKSARGTP